MKSPIHLCAEKLKISIRCPENLDTADEYNYIKKLEADVAVVVAYGKIIPSKILDLNNTTFINIHASILPKWRGAAPIQRAIMNKDKETGISIMKIIEKLDAGPVMQSVKVTIKNNDTYESLSKKISSISALTIIECLDVIKNKKERYIPQDNAEATYAKKIEKSETKINWNDKAKNVLAKINALHPNPGCWFELNGSRIKVLKAIEIKSQEKPGKVIDNKLSISCSENAIQILQLKKEGKNSMNTSDFLKGYNLKIGTNLNEK